MPDPAAPPDDQLKRYRRDHALWTLGGMMEWCLEHGDERQLEALTTLEVVLNELMRENAELRAQLRVTSRIVSEPPCMRESEWGDPARPVSEGWWFLALLLYGGFAYGCLLGYIAGRFSRQRRDHETTLAS